MLATLDVAHLEPELVTTRVASLAVGLASGGCWPAFYRSWFGGVVVDNRKDGVVGLSMKRNLHDGHVALYALQLDVASHEAGGESGRIAILCDGLELYFEGFYKTITIDGLDSDRQWVSWNRMSC